MYGHERELAALLSYYDPGVELIIAIVNRSKKLISTQLSLIPLQSIDREDWRYRVSIVFQDSYLFPDKIQNNLLLGRNHSKEEMIEACKAAHIHDTIMSLPDEYETMLGERGITFSGGQRQRQRLAIARALLGNPEILILDEATSALDQETERRVSSNIDTIRKGKTTILIAPRLSTVENADMIFVVDQGKIVESGSHKELILHEGTYKKLVFARSDLQSAL